MFNPLLILCLPTYEEINYIYAHTHTFIGVHIYIDSFILMENSILIKNPAKTLNKNY